MNEKRGRDGPIITLGVHFHGRNLPSSRVFAVASDFSFSSCLKAKSAWKRQQMSDVFLFNIQRNVHVHLHTHHVHIMCE